MKNSEKVKFENDNLAQVQGYSNFENSPKGDTTMEVIEHINEKLDDVYPEMSPEEEYLFLACYDERMQRMMEDPDFQEESMRMAQFYER